MCKCKVCGKRTKDLAVVHTTKGNISLCRSCEDDICGFDSHGDPVFGGDIFEDQLIYGVKIPVAV